MIIAITDMRSYGNAAEHFKKIAGSRPDMIILREKHLSEKEYLDLLKGCINSCPGSVELAAHTHSSAKSLNIGRLHLPFAATENEYPEGFRDVGVSVHSEEEAVRAEEWGASYLIAGHVFRTGCKNTPPRGTSFIASVCSSVSVPVFAIGGIDPKNAGNVMNAGASGICVMSSLSVQDPDRVISGLRDSV